VYILTAILVLYFNWIGRSSGLVEVATYVAVGVTVASGLHYIVHAARVLREI